MIDKALILKQLESMAAERVVREAEFKAAADSLQQIAGAEKLCRAWLDKCEREEAGPKTTDSSPGRNTESPADGVPVQN